jgi:hypothetical protein
MVRKSVLRLGLAVLMSLAGVSVSAAQAPGDTAHQGTATDYANASDSTDTYTTLDGYGVGRIVPGALADVTLRARTAMVKMKIVEEPTRSLGRQLKTLRGKKGSTDVVISLRFQSVNTTRVEVTAREGGALWDKGLEEQVLDAIGKR